MKKHFAFRIAALAGVAVLSAASLAMFAGCTTDKPEITITYTFNDVDYDVDYVLSRRDAPQTVTHFIELADAGYYDGMCIHDYQTNGAFLYAGGYTIENGELVEKDYFSEVLKLEREKGIKFTQSVFMENEARTPLYTVFGEFEDNGTFPQNRSREFKHEKGALVMYYTPKGNFNGKVLTLRNDGGKDNNGDPYNHNVAYGNNSATALFYTYTGDSRSDLDKKYSVFGMASHYTDQLENGLLKAIKDFIADEERGEDYVFAPETSAIRLNRLDHNYSDEDLSGFSEEEREAFEAVKEAFDGVRKGDLTEQYETPIQNPIIIKSIRVNKY